MESLYYGDKEIKKIMYGGREIRPEPPIDYIELTAEITAANQTVKVNKYFANVHNIEWGDGSPVANHTADTTHTYSAAGTYKIKLTLAGGATRWTFVSASKPLVPTAGTTASNIYISSMPSLADYFGANATNPGDYFFYSFNRGGALTALPENSFDTSKITTAGNDFFSSFNRDGALTSLPAGSFDTSKITTVGDYFFYYFNFNGALTSLPVGSFDTSKITNPGNDFFSSFNYNGALTSLPAGSFDTSKITTVGDYFFYYFNFNGALTSLPVGSFDTSKITNPGNFFFSSFNHNGALTSLPVGSFDTSNITRAERYFFSSFNHNGALTSLPAGSFDTSKITTVGDYFFRYFNFNGALTSLPAGSFILSQLPVASRANYFTSFNSNSGKLTKQVGGIQIKNAHNAAINFHYWNGSSTVSESVSSGNSFNGYTVG